jgi:Eco29kI restriction endonuclease
MSEVYNPLEKYNLGRSVVDALLELPPINLNDLSPFDGAGIYALYYQGAFEPYRLLTGAVESRELAPIYVGKAVPSGSRRGASLTTTAVGRSLYSRIREHRDSIAAVRNLEVADFSVRYLTVDDIWIPLAESLLISTFNPVWNHLIDGFGNHDPGAGRRQGLVPLWDVLHPGRSWAPKCKPRTETLEELSQRVIDHLAIRQR